MLWKSFWYLNFFSTTDGIFPSVAICQYDQWIPHINEHHNSTNGNEHDNSTNSNEHHNSTNGNEHHNSTNGNEHDNSTNSNEHHNSTNGNEQHNSTNGNEQHNCNNTSYNCSMFDSKCNSSYENCRNKNVTLIEFLDQSSLRWFWWTYCTYFNLRLQKDQRGIMDVLRT